MKKVNFEEFVTKIRKERKSKVYKLRGNGAPPTFLIPVVSKKNKKLEFFDEQKGYPRTLRFSPNQSSPIEDEQKGSVILAPLEFRDGLMMVSAEQTTLQVFMELHPDFGTKFVLEDKAKDAAQELEEMDLIDEATQRARELKDEALEHVAILILGENVVDKLSTFEMKRDIRVYARNNPEMFLKIISDPMKDQTVQVKKFFKEGLLSFRNNQNEVYYNLKNKKNRLIRVPEGSDPYEVVTDFLTSDDGIADLKILDAAYDEKLD